MSTRASSAVLEPVKAPGGHPAEAPLARLHAEIERIAKRATGPVGIAAVHLNSNTRVSFNAAERFPMASTCKIALAVKILRMVEQQELSLEQMIELQPGDLHPGSGTLSSLFIRKGVVLSIHNLLELTMRISDNSATDLLLRVAGGGSAVNEFLQRSGIDGMNLDRTLLDVLVERNGLPQQPKDFAWVEDTYDELCGKVDKDEREAARNRFESDPRDTSTPGAMVALLQKLRKGELLNAQHTDLLLKLMQSCKTGHERLRGMLPPETIVAHKTGTFNKVLVADAGVITLPYELGDVAIAAFVRRTENDVSERIIAHISRAVYDFFLFHTPPGGKLLW